MNFWRVLILSVPIKLVVYSFLWNISHKAVIAGLTLSVLSLLVGMSAQESSP